MNKDNVLKVADAIEKHSIPGLGFNMIDYRCETGKYGTEDLSGHGCGTVACIAGYATVVAHGNQALRGSEHGDARVFLDLDDDEANDLFYGEGAGRLGHILPSQAVAVLRHLAETGEVDWTITKVTPNA